MTFRPFLFCVGAELFGAAFCTLAAAQSTVPMLPVVVTALRTETPGVESPFSTRAVDGAALRQMPALTLDAALRSVPSFSLFRRSDSLTAHPTAQGVSLRGLGPSGASRSLVLLDGVPLNDPFGGWVAWTKVPRESLAAAEIVSGGGGTSWGNAALGGVVQLLTRAPSEDSAAITALAGDFETRSVEWQAAQTWRRPAAGSADEAAQGALQVSGRWFSTQGYGTVAPEARGSVDEPAGQRHRLVSMRWVQPLSSQTSATLEARWFREKRENGTPYQRNDSEEAFVAATVQSRVNPQFAWKAVAYGQDQTFASTFSAVSPDRTTETPASDQYDVPAEAWGAAWTGEWGRAGHARTVAGVDSRVVRGESKERFTYSNGQFTRERAAGGRQATLGVFALHERRWGEVAAVAGVRGDLWRESAGFRRERDIASGASLRSEDYPERDGAEFSPSLGIEGGIGENIGWRVSGQHAFRRPTLNELYRPFRVGNVITEANAALDTERVTSLEAALSAERGAFHGEVTAFWSELRGAVANVTVARGPGNVPGFGFIPAGGVGRLRQNLDRVRVRGVELSGRWNLSSAWALTAEVLLNEAEVTRASVAPGLVGKRLAQVPKTSAALGAEWRPAAGWRLSSRGRWMGAQFEDDENNLRLAPAFVVDVTIARSFGSAGELFAVLENAFDERIETGRSAANVINVGTPRFVSGGVRWGW